MGCRWDGLGVVGKRGAGYFIGAASGGGEAEERVFFVGAGSPALAGANAGKPHLSADLLKWLWRNLGSGKGQKGVRKVGKALRAGAVAAPQATSGVWRHIGLRVFGKKR